MVLSGEQFPSREPEDPKKAFNDLFKFENLFPEAHAAIEEEKRQQVIRMAELLAGDRNFMKMARRVTKGKRANRADPYRQIGELDKDQN